MLKKAIIHDNINVTFVMYILLINSVNLCVKVYKKLNNNQICVLLI